MKIIVVDDEEDVQFLFKQQFKKEIKSGQVEFYFAFSGEATLKYIEQQGIGQISLIISDVNMPGMSGLELLKIIKQNFEYVKVFIMTAYSDIQTQQIAKDYQADDYITKPVNFAQLKAKILSD